MKEPGIDTRGQAMPSANGDKGDDGEDNAADDEPRALHHVRVDHGAQAALHRVEGGENGEADHNRRLVPTE
jgi:hypothetical protein